MKEILLELFDSLYKGRMTKENFLLEFENRTGALLNEEFCIEQINKGIIECDSDTIDLFIQLGFMVVFTKKSLPIMGKILSLDCHHKHEDVAMLLKDIPDPNMVDCLYEATELKFGYLDYDDTYQFARKCIKALSVIENENAIEKLKLLTNSKNLTIAEYAKKELRYKRLL